MKKFLAVFLLLLVASSAQAVPVWFDADGAGSDYAPVRISELSGEATLDYTVTVDLGIDGKLGNNDEFTETFMLRINEASLSSVYGGTGKVADYPDEVGSFAPSLWATVSLTGKVVNYTDNLGGGTTEANIATAILDDTFELTFDATPLSVNLYYDADYANAPAAFTLGQFDVLGGGSDLFERDNDTLTSDVGINLAGNILSSNVWFVDNNGVMGADVTTLSETVLLSLADSSVNLIGFGEGLVSGDDIVAILVEDNGTDIEFTPVPEPATLVLFGLGLLGLAATGRKRS